MPVRSTTLRKPLHSPPHGAFSRAPSAARRTFDPLSEQGVTAGRSKAKIIQVPNDLTCMSVEVAEVLVVCQPPGGSFHVDPDQRDLIREPIESPRSWPTRICDGTGSGDNVDAQAFRGAGDPDRRRSTRIEPGVDEGTSNVRLERAVVLAVGKLALSPVAHLGGHKKRVHFGGAGLADRHPLVLDARDETSPVEDRDLTAKTSHGTDADAVRPCDARHFNPPVAAPLAQDLAHLPVDEHLDGIHARLVRRRAGGCEQKQGQRVATGDRDRS